MAAARMQRWALTLSAYQYTIEQINGIANNCADCMSRLPLSGQALDSAEKIHVVVQMDDMPVTATQIVKESKWDKELSIVLKSIQHGHWPSDTTVDLSPFCKRYTELSVHPMGLKSGNPFSVLPVTVTETPYHSFGDEQNEVPRP